MHVSYLMFFSIVLVFYLMALLDHQDHSDLTVPKAEIIDNKFGTRKGKANSVYHEFFSFSSLTVVPQGIRVSKRVFGHHINYFVVIIHFKIV